MADDQQGAGTMNVSDKRLKHLAGIHDTLAGFFEKMVGFDSEAEHSVARNRDTAAALRAVLAVREWLSKYQSELPMVGTPAARIAMQELSDELRAIVGAAEGDR